MKNVLEYLENSAALYPEKTAFSDESGEISFSELMRKSKALGSKIAERGITKSPVAVFVNRGFASLIGFFAALYSGNFYVPVDTKMPVNRMKVMFEKLSPSLILYESADAELASGFDLKREEIEFSHDIDEEKLKEIRAGATDTDPVYVIFTSGSTGTPKGIVIPHRAVIDFTEWMAKASGIRHEDVMGNQAPFYFDCSVKDIYQTLKAGATAHIIPKKLFMTPVNLIDFLNEKKVTALIWATSGFHLVAASKVLEKRKPLYLRVVAPGGEAMNARYLNAWREALPDVLYINLYGPTEATVDCSYYVIDRDFENGEPIPIGKACDNKELILLSGDRSAEDNEPGEICVRGSGLAFGYYNDPEKTAAVFVRNPLNKNYPEIIYRTGDIAIRKPDGNIVFQSRADGQIKHMGYRIETGEIERAVMSFEKIVSAVCFFDSKADRIICVYEGDCADSEIITHIKKLIPKYMFPNKYMKLEKMIYNANGKTDRPALEKLYYEKSE